MWIYSAFLFGFLGSFHCVGMCGPIALALPPKKNTAFLTGRFLYNSGRIFTYGILGALAGVFGRTLAMAGLQKTVSIVSGILIILFVLIPLIVKGNHSAFLYAWTSKIKQMFRHIFATDSKLTMLSIGLVNGLLPCGFVYLALAASLAMGSIGGSAGYMMLFGLGTLPMMLAISLSGHVFNVRFQKYFRKAVPFIAVALGVWLIARGVMIESHSCCHR